MIQIEYLPEVNKYHLDDRRNYSGKKWSSNCYYKPNEISIDNKGSPIVPKEFKIAAEAAHQKRMEYINNE